MTEQDFREKYKGRLMIKKSPPDRRTFKVRKVIPKIALPVKTNNIQYELSVMDQGEYPICAGMSGAGDQENMDARDIGLKEHLSAMYLYNNRSNQESDGMTNLDLMKIRQKKGTCLERLYPIGSTEEPSEEAVTDALNHRIGPYAQIDTLDELKTIMAMGRTPTIAVPVYNFTPRMWYQRPGDENEGGHDMRAIDYNDETRKIKIKNSWGEEFGDKGYIEMDYDDFAFAWEWWTGVDLPSAIPDPDPEPNPDPEPEPEPKKKSWFRRNLWWITTIAILIAFTVFILIKKS